MITKQLFQARLKLPNFITWMQIQVLPVRWVAQTAPLQAPFVLVLCDRERVVNKPKWSKKTRTFRPV